MNAALHPLVLKGRQAFQAGDLSGALSMSEMRLQEAPNDALALELKAVVLQRRGDLDGAETAYRRAIATDPTSDLWNDLTQMLHASGKAKAAETAARETLLVRPDDAQAHLQLAVILGEKDDLPAAEFHNRRALVLAGPHPQILTNLALCLYNQGRLDEAETLFFQAHTATPDTAMIMAHLSRVYEARRDMPNAWLWLDRAEAAGRRNGEDFSLLRALFLGNSGQPQSALDLIDQAGPDIAAPARLDRARLLDKLGRYDEAWPVLVDAKAQLARDMGLAYDTAQVAGEFAALKAFFTADRLARLPHARLRMDGPRPIFIIGFPRSGTTMIEQMLNSHPDIAAGGELPFAAEWPALIDTLLPSARPFPQKLAQAQTFDFHHIPGELRDYYLGRAEVYGVTGQQPFFTDKMPLNDVFLPLIRLAFPMAAVIRMVRHPLDVAISMLSHNLTHGYNSGYTMETIITHMRAMHDLTAHYDAVFDQPPLTLRYEDFIADQEGQTRRVLGYIGVDFDPACLRFHENRRHAPTPSYAQVSQPLNDRSVGRWRHYEKQLAPYMDAIAPIIEALGYSRAGSADRTA
jgi:Flp pilus assembly protein TadD